jgi:hypothetical protein
MSDLLKKWAPVLDAEGVAPIKDKSRRLATAQLLENQERFNASGSTKDSAQVSLTEAVAANNGGTGIALGQSGSNAYMAGYDPVMISLVRRTAPVMIAYDLCSVQPMTQPSGLVFGLKSRYGSQSGKEALYKDVDSSWSGKVAAVDGTGNPVQPAFPASDDPFGDALNINHGMTTAEGEDAGMNEMALSIERGSVTVKTRSLKAEYTVELEQDLRSVHSLDAEAELTNILTTEILAEMNREILQTIYKTGVKGATSGTTTAGVFDLDTDSNGRWAVEKYKGLMFRIEQEANAIAATTRAGKGNLIICTADVASALAMAGVLDQGGNNSLGQDLEVDTTNTAFAGILNGRYKVYVDPYAQNSANTQYFVVGYRGNNLGDAGLIYAPYVPLQALRATDPRTFQPKIAFKTRYALAANGMSNMDGTFNTALTPNMNQYFRKILVKSL